MEEFLKTCHHASYDDVCLVDGFRCGLDDIHFVMPQGDPGWTLKDYINPRHHYLHYLLSVVRAHRRPAGSHFLLVVMSPWLLLQPRSVLVHN